jgi:hypothetical protein
MMMLGEQRQSAALVDWVVKVALSLPWIEVLSESLRIVRSLFRETADEGLYEVLEYDSTLELQDKKGIHASFHKRQKVRFLQNNTIAFQDIAWGDGTTLLDYGCTPGKVVDMYRPGQTTLILISLREMKQRGDLEEFNIEWKMHNTFTRAEELWETQFKHRVKWCRIRVIFPKTRPPLRVWMVEDIHRVTQPLDGQAITQLPDGRWSVTWQTEKPARYEKFMLKWEW